MAEISLFAVDPQTHERHLAFVKGCCHTKVVIGVGGYLKVGDNWGVELQAPMGRRLRLNGPKVGVGYLGKGSQPSPSTR